MVVTNNPNYQTENGVKSGALINKISDLLGPPTLSYNRNHPLEEKLRFKSQPRWMLFSSYSQVKAGIYKGNQQVNMTKYYLFGAKIQFIGIR